MLRSRKLGIWLTTTAAVVTGLLALPVAAEADSCTIAVTLGNGQKLSFTVNVPPGTPLSAINLPVVSTVVSVTETCASPTTTTTTTTSTTGTLGPPLLTGTTTTGSTTSTTAPSTTTTSSSLLGVTVQPQSTTTTATTTPTSTVSTKPVVGSSTTPTGAPTDNNPTFSFATFGAANVGSSNYFIDQFQIPPFLLPIYQAAGIEYNVPWQVLAAINWIETDFGRDLNVSSAGAEGWMQFLPSTWKQWGVDATGSGYADPYNPTDAIFTAARYLAAAGASKSLFKAVYAYNHADWYVQSVLLRAQLIGGMSSSLISSLTQLVEGHFPVAATATYADDSPTKTVDQAMDGSKAVTDEETASAQGTNIFAKTGSEVIAVNDGKIVGIGHSKKLGTYIKLQDDNGNVYTYSQLGSIPKLYAVPKQLNTTKAELTQEEKDVQADSGTGTSTTPKRAATAGSQPNSVASLPSTRSRNAKANAKSRATASSLLTVTLDASAETGSTTSVKTKATPATTTRSSKAKANAKTKPKTAKSSASSPVTAKERLFANPTRPASYAAGGEQQLQSENSAISSFKDYFADVLHLAKNQYTLAPLTKGSVVVAGTVIGRVGRITDGRAPHVYFQIQPGGTKSTYIDPKSILDGWKLLEATSIYRANGLDPFLSSSRQATIGQILLESKEQLQETVIKDPRVKVYACGRRDIETGAIDRRVLAVMEYLADSGLEPTVSGLKCGAGSTPGIDSAGQTGASMDISAINGIPIAGHSGTGSITDITIRRLLSLQGSMQPTDIISGISYKGQANTLALPDHKNRIQITFTPEFGTDKKLTNEVRSALSGKQWIELINHISEIPEPSVQTTVSASAIKTKTQ